MNQDIVSQKIMKKAIEESIQEKKKRISNIEEEIEQSEIKCAKAILEQKLALTTSDADRIEAANHNIETELENLRKTKETKKVEIRSLRGDIEYLQTITC